MKNAVDGKKGDSLATQLCFVGAAVIPLLNPLEVTRCLQEASQCSFVQRCCTETGVEQNFSSTQLQYPRGMFRDIAYHLAAVVEGSLKSYRFFLEPLAFNDFSLQRYPVSDSGQSYGISPHRDHVHAINLIAVLLLQGESAFYLCKDRSGSDSQLIKAPVGSVILMRGYRFGESRGKKFDRPIHYVGRVTQERLSFTMRQAARGTTIPNS